MNIGQLKAAIAGYLQLPVTDFIVGSGATQVDLLLLAINEARRTAETLHDFSHLLGYGLLHLQASTPQASPTAYAGTQPGTQIRKHRQWWALAPDTALDYTGVQNNTLFPVKVRNSASVHQAHLQRIYDTDVVTESLRYTEGTDSPLYEHPLLSQTTLISIGKQFVRYPTLTSGYQFFISSCYYWAPDYTTNTDTDFFTEHGFKYLLWQSIVECNHLPLTFTPRQEGALGPPTALADSALSQLILADQESENSGSVIEQI